MFSSFGRIMTKKVFILLFFTLVVILIPSVALACGGGSDKCCAKSESCEKSDTKDCCKKNNHRSKNKKGCGGKCGSNSCHCPSSNFGLALPVFLDASCTTFIFSTEKVKFYYIKTFPTSGFCALWLPPKIG